MSAVMKVAFLAAVVSASDAELPPPSRGGHGFKSSKPWLPRAPVGAAMPVELLVGDTVLPQNFDWRNVGGKNLVTADWNQHIPQYCGSCWIHGTTSALNDRIKAMRGGSFPDVMLGRQAILNCVPAADGEGPPPGCNGGDSWMIHKYLHDHKVPDESCMPYQARNMGCASENVCRNCFPDEKGCFNVKSWIGYGVSSYGNVSGEAAMMKEIYARGPIACAFATDDAFMMNYSENALQHEGVYVTDQKYNESQIDHVMEVAGWGETPSGIKYWIIRNSWGTYWGEAGWLKMRRGVNQQLSENGCDWAVPTFDDLDASLANRVMGDYVLGIEEVAIDGVSQPISSQPSAPTVSLLAQQTESGSDISWNAQMGLAIASAFVAGIGVSLLVYKLFGGARIQQRPLLG